MGVGGGGVGCRERTEEGEEGGRWNRVAVNFNLESNEREGDG